MIQKTEVIVRTIELVQFGLLSLIGGIANYFYYNQKTERAFSVIQFMTNIIVSFFLGMVVGDFVPEGEYKYGLVMVSGFCCYPLLGLIEYKVKQFIKKEEV